MDAYNIVLAHGPVIQTEYIGNDTVVFTLDDGRVFIIRFSVVERGGQTLHRRDITDKDGKSYEDETDFDVFDEDLTTGQNYAEWTEGNATYKIWLEDETALERKLELINKLLNPQFVASADNKPQNISLELL